MNIYDFAMQMEKDGENYYRELAAASKIAGLKKIFGMLADEEIQHFEIFQQLKEKGGEPGLPESKILTHVKNIFVGMKEDKPQLHIDTTKDSDAFRKARDIERKSMEFYLEKAETAEHASIKNILNRLAKEEEKHLNIMENLVEFISRPEPGHWLENAEWHHLEEY